MGVIYQLCRTQSRIVTPLVGRSDLAIFKTRNGEQGIFKTYGEYLKREFLKRGMFKSGNIIFKTGNLCSDLIGI